MVRTVSGWDSGSDAKRSAAFSCDNVVLGIPRDVKCLELGGDATDGDVAGELAGGTKVLDLDGDVVLRFDVTTSAIDVTALGWLANGISWEHGDGDAAGVACCDTEVGLGSVCVLAGACPASGGDDIGIHAAVRGGDVARGLVGGGDVGDLDGDAALGPDTAPALAVSGGTGLGVTDGDTRERDVGAPAGGGGAAVAGLGGNALVVADTITAAAASGVTGLGISDAALGLGNGATGRISVAAVGGRAGVALTFGDDVDRDTTVVGGEVKRSVVAALPPL
ncbi:hypothetical protein ON010_g7512 [Phytophthora cinnamomi]|nr:hypothetical protein ON010_g7512 [Phytophthora cinnamomi]